MTRPTEVSRPRVSLSNWWTRLAWLVVAAIVVFSVLEVDARWDRLGRLFTIGPDYFEEMFLPPNTAVTGEAIGAMVDSIQMAWVGTVIAAVISLPLAFLAAANLVPAPLRWTIRMIFNVIRAVPELVLAVILLTITGLTPFTGALAIGIHSIGTLGRLTAEAIEEAPKGPMEAAVASGARWGQRIRTAVWPSVAPQVMSVWLYRFEVNIRASAVLGMIGAGGIGALIPPLIRLRHFAEVGMILIVLVVMTVAIDLLSGMVRGALVTGRWPWDRWRNNRRTEPTQTDAAVAPAGSAQSPTAQSPTAQSPTAQSPTAQSPTAPSASLRKPGPPQP